MAADIAGQSALIGLGAQQGLDGFQAMRSGLISAGISGAGSIAAAAIERAAVARATAQAAQSELSCSVASRKLVNCFPPDTLVSTEAGLRPIAQIGAGERVWAYDFQGGVWRLCEVECRHNANYDGPLVTLGVGEVTATAYHPFWVVEGRDLESRPALRDVAISEDRGRSLAGRWVNSHNLREGDVVFLRGRGPVAVRRAWHHHERTAVCNLTVRGLHTFAVGQNQVLVHNTSGTGGAPQNRWQWTPSRQQPVAPRPGGTAPSGDIPELIQHVGQIRGQGATLAEAEEAWADGMRLINQRAAQFPGNGPVVNNFLGTAQGGWRVYMGQPAQPSGPAFIVAFNEQTGMVVSGTGRGLVPHPTIPGQNVLLLQNQTVIFP